MKKNRQICKLNRATKDAQGRSTRPNIKNRD